MESSIERGRAQRPRVRCRPSAWCAAIVAASLAASASAQPASAPRSGDEALVALAPYAAQIMQLAALEPAFAATLVPDAWIEAIVDGALAVEAESAVQPERADPPRQWPIGPWPTAASLASAIEALDSARILALYRELHPRLTATCLRGGASAAACDRAMRVSGSRLAANSVLERAALGRSEPITPTQRELARLGVPVVSALRDQIQLLGIALWGVTWSADP